MSIIQNNKHEDSNWKKLIEVLKKRHVISSDELSILIKEYTDTSPEYGLRYLKRKGLLSKSKTIPRGLYIVSIYKDNGSIISDPVETIQAFWGKKIIFGYGTALFIHNLSRYARMSEYYLVSEYKRKSHIMENITVRFIKTSMDKKIGIMTLPYGNIKIQSTDLERTLVDCVHRPKYAQGWENVIHALERAKGVNGNRMIEYVKQYRTPSLVSKVGIILEHYSKKWNVAPSEINSLRPYLPKGPVKFTRGSSGKLNKNWKIYIPEDLFHE